MPRRRHPLTSTRLTRTHPPPSPPGKTQLLQQVDTPPLWLSITVTLLHLHPLLLLPLLPLLRPPPRPTLRKGVAQDRHTLHPPALTVNASRRPLFHSMVSIPPGVDHAAAIHPRAMNQKVDSESMNASIVQSGLIGLVLYGFTLTPTPEQNPSNVHSQAAGDGSVSCQT